MEEKLDFHPSTVQKKRQIALRPHVFETQRLGRKIPTCFWSLCSEMPQTNNSLLKELGTTRHIFQGKQSRWVVKWNRSSAEKYLGSPLVTRKLLIKSPRTLFQSECTRCLCSRWINSASSPSRNDAYCWSASSWNTSASGAMLLKCGWFFFFFFSVYIWKWPHFFHYLWTDLNGSPRIKDELEIRQFDI